MYKNDSLLQLELDKLVKEINDSKNKAKMSQYELNKLKKKLLEAQKKIKDLKENPPFKDNDDLLKSLKNNIER